MQVQWISINHSRLKSYTFKIHSIACVLEVHFIIFGFDLSLKYLIKEVML